MNQFITLLIHILIVPWCALNNQKDNRSISPILPAETVNSPQLWRTKNKEKERFFFFSVNKLITISCLLSLHQEDALWFFFRTAVWWFQPQSPITTFYSLYWVTTFPVYMSTPSQSGLFGFISMRLALSLLWTNSRVHHSSIVFFFT